MPVVVKAFEIALLAFFEKNCALGANRFALGRVYALIPFALALIGEIVGLQEDTALVFLTALD
jgi:hypothetical protein